jgi:hypothetical protein
MFVCSSLKPVLVFSLTNLLLSIFSQIAADKSRMLMFALMEKSSAVFKVQKLIA